MSPSVTTALYWIVNDPPMHGDIVLVELSELYRTIANQRGYLPKSLPAMKCVRALCGDKICRFGSKIFVNKEAVSVAHSHDIDDLKLLVVSGCRKLKPDEILLLPVHLKRFDGRYFVPIDRSSIAGIAYPVWTD